jgi:capsular polysaccharide biosynthesis protein
MLGFPSKGDKELKSNMSSKKLILILATYLTLILGLSNCTFFRCIPIGQIQIKDFKRREIEVMQKSCNDSRLLIVQPICSFSYTTIRKLKSEELVQIIIDKFKLKNNKNNSLTYQEFIDNLQVKYWKRKDIITISYKAEDSQSAIKIVNALMTTYMHQENSKVKMSVAMESRVSLQETLKEYQREVNSLKGLIEKSSSKDDIERYHIQLTYIQKYYINQQKMIEEVDRYLSAVKQQTQMENLDGRIIKFADNSCYFFQES